MSSKLYGVALRQFGRLPVSVRHRIVGMTSPAYRVGTVGIILTDDGKLLLAKHSYRDGWGLPGGMIGWREEPLETVKREMHEEVNLTVVEAGPPHVEHAQKPRRVEWFFDLRLDGCTADDAKVSSAEIAELAWFPLDDLPQLERKSPTTHTALTTIADRHFPGKLNLP